MKLPCIYTQEDLPVDINEVSTIDTIKRCGYLEKIKAEVNANNNIKVTLLISANCVKALEPHELTASKKGRPYAFRALLGWCIVRPMYCHNNSEKLSCNKIMAKSVVTGLPSNHCFTQSNKVRNTSIEGLLMKMYERDFVEPQLQHCANKININYDKFSRNDRRFLDFMDQKAVKVDGHYELPMSLKDEEIRLPNNRAAEMKHL